MSDSKSRRDFIAESVAGIPRSGIRDFFDIVNRTPDAISLGVGEPGFDTPWHIRDASIYSLEKGATGYTSNLGLEELRSAIAAYVASSFHMTYDPEREILVTTGVSEGLDLALRAVIDPGDEILFHEPSYVSYRPVIELAHGIPVSVETAGDTNFEISRQSVESKITARTKAIILNYPNNPTGAILPRPKLEAIADLAVKNDLLVISDEIYAELTYDHEHISIGSLPGMKHRTLFLHGFSKAWAMTGFRVGYCCAPPALIEAMMTIHQYTMLCAPILSQAAALEALRKADADVAEMRTRYRRNRNYISQAFAEMDISCPRPGGAFYAFPNIDGLGLTSEQFAVRLLEEASVAAVPGTAFGKCGAGYLRCSYATAFEELREALSRMSRFVDRLRNR